VVELTTSEAGYEMDPAYVITLVHGTWADTKGWVSPGSALRRDIRRYAQAFSSLQRSRPPNAIPSDRDLE